MGRAGAVVLAVSKEHGLLGEPGAGRAIAPTVRQQARPDAREACGGWGEPGCCGDPGRSNKHAEELQRARRDREAECARQAAPGGGGRDEGRLTVPLLLGSIVPLCNRFDLAALYTIPPSPLQTSLD